MVEATFPEEGGVEVLGIEPTEWRGLAGYRFDERWSDGPAEVLVLQSPDQWLYLLRVRSRGGLEISHLLRDIQTSFTVEE
jgi:hypothetical protein